MPRSPLEDHGATESPRRGHNAHLAACALVVALFFTPAIRENVVTGNTGSAVTGGGEMGGNSCNESVGCP